MSYSLVDFLWAPLLVLCGKFLTPLLMVLVGVCYLELKSCHKEKSAKNPAWIFRFFYVKSYLHVFIQHIITRTKLANIPNLYNKCCAFRPAFGCCMHSKAGQNIFFHTFSTFFLEKSSSTSFWLQAAPKSWSKYTTSKEIHFSNPKTGVNKFCVLKLSEKGGEVKVY